MKRTTALFTLMLLSSVTGWAQQDPMFTKYMFNSLIFNPAYAGSRDHLTATLLHRTQWWGIKGAPQTQTLTVHTPMKNDKVGIGGSIVNDQIGPTNSLSFNASYAYRIPMGKYKLAIGVQGGMYNWRADWTKLSIYDENDPAFSEITPNYWRPNVGAGLYFSSKNFYTGLGVPRIIEYDLTKSDRPGQTPIYAKQYRHYFWTIGGAIPLKGKSLVFKPSALIKSAALDSRLHRDSAFQNVGAPTEFNIDLSLFFNETIWIGTSFRSAIEVFSKDNAGNSKSTFDSADIWFAYYLKSGLRIGASYDYTLTKLQQKAQGSFEVMLGYEMDYQERKVVTPRYF
ncbi:MAG: hypothetical protein RL757_148 [Bacteroidota bacterium]|jgi:type IX secretion system PorP/SprF family membrane protein